MQVQGEKDDLMCGLLPFRFHQASHLGQVVLQPLVVISEVVVYHLELQLLNLCPSLGSFCLLGLSIQCRLLAC